MSEKRCRHDLLEDCPDCLRDEIASLRAQLDTLQTAMTAPTKEEIELRAQLAEARIDAQSAHDEVVRTQDELGALLHHAEAQLASARKALEAASYVLRVQKCFSTAQMCEAALSDEKGT